MSDSEPKQEAPTASSLNDKQFSERMSKCRKVWKTDYARILTHAKATGELSSYERLHSAITMNKGVTFGLFPLVAGGAYAHIWKMKPTDISKH